MASKEETVARKVFDLIADIRLNPYYIGFHLAHTPDPNIYDMLREIVEAMDDTMIEREQRLKEMILNDNHK
jgi:hypothetical protein